MCLHLQFTALSAIKALALHRAHLKSCTRAHCCTSHVVAAVIARTVQVNVGFDIIGVKVCPLNDSHVAVWGLMRCAVVVFSNPSAGENMTSYTCLHHCVRIQCIMALLYSRNSIAGVLLCTCLIAL
jgi:hypothetical protein